jgi:hypothetical protein
MEGGEKRRKNEEKVGTEGEVEEGGEGEGRNGR